MWLPEPDYLELFLPFFCSGWTQVIIPVLGQLSAIAQAASGEGLDPGSGSSDGLGREMAGQAWSLAPWLKRIRWAEEFC